MVKSQKELMIEAGAAIVYEQVAEAFEPAWRDVIWRAYLAMKARENAFLMPKIEIPKSRNSIDARLDRLRGRR